ncbi:MAG: acyl-ACP--UDP-N-acetylglucosamine O-acyltransferase [Planctomycetes bacterium]|nr:acyl-ACP--UDP-N-acetylglucosamine O-acyltransferase [Planctomycetota bacterium]
MSIHPTAVVSPRAKIAPDTEVGPFCVVGPDVEIGPGCVLRSRVTLSGRVRTGARNVFHPTVVIGGPPQDEQPAAPDARIEIGDDNVFHESFTAHQPKVPGSPTRIGSSGRFEQGSHVPHDARIGNGVVLGKLVLLAGHVVVDDYVRLGAYTVVHQFVTIGRYVLIGRHSAISEDAPPFLRYVGQSNTPVGVRVEELARQGFPPATVAAIQEAYRTVWESGLPRHEAVRGLESSAVPEVREMARVLRSSLQGRMGRAREALRRG